MLQVCTNFLSSLVKLPQTEEKQNQVTSPGRYNVEAILEYLACNLTDTIQADCQELNQQHNLEDFMPNCAPMLRALNQCDKDNAIVIELPISCLLLNLKESENGVSMRINGIERILAGASFQQLREKLTVIDQKIKELEIPEEHSFEKISSISDEGNFDLMENDGVEVDSTQRKKLGTTTLNTLIYNNINKSVFHIELNKPENHYVVTCLNNESKKITVYATIEQEEDATNFISNNINSKNPIFVPYVAKDRGYFRDDHVVLLAIVNQQVYLIDSGNGEALGNLQHDIILINLNWQGRWDVTHCGYYLFEIFAQITEHFNQQEFNSTNPFAFLQSVPSSEYDLENIDQKMAQLTTRHIPFSEK